MVFSFPVVQPGVPADWFIRPPSSAGCAGWLVYPATIVSRVRWLAGLSGHHRQPDTAAYTL